MKNRSSVRLATLTFLGLLLSAGSSGVQAGLSASKPSEVRPPQQMVASAKLEDYFQITQNLNLSKSERKNPTLISEIYSGRYLQFLRALAIKLPQYDFAKLEQKSPKVTTPFTSLQSERDFFRDFIVSNIGDVASKVETDAAMDAKGAIESITIAAGSYPGTNGLVARDVGLCDVRHLKGDVQELLKSVPSVTIVGQCAQGSDSSELPVVIEAVRHDGLAAALNQMQVQNRGEFYEILRAFREDPSAQQEVQAILAMLIEHAKEMHRVDPEYSVDYLAIAQHFRSAYNRCALMKYPNHALNSLFESEPLVVVTPTIADRIYLDAHNLQARLKKEATALNITIAPTLPSLDVLRGVSLTPGVGVGISPAHDSDGGVFRMDKVKLNVGVNPGDFIEGLPFSFGASAGAELVYVRKFKTQREGLTAVPFRMKGLPISCKNALKMNEGDFLGMPIKTALTVGADIDVKGGFSFIPLKGNASTAVIVEGEYITQIFRLKDNRVRLRLILNNGAKGTLAASLKVSGDITGTGIIDSALAKGADLASINPNLLSAATSRFRNQGHTVDFVFDLSDAQACMAYEKILKDAAKFSRAMKATIAQKNIGFSADSIGDTSMADQLQAQQKDLPNRSDRKVIRVLDGRHLSDGATQSLGLSGLVMQMSLDRTASDNFFALKNSNDTFQNYYFPTVTLNRSSKWVAGINTANVRETAFSVFPTDADRNVTGFNSSGLSYDYQDSLLTPSELKATEQRLVNILPKVIEDQLNLAAPWQKDYERHYLRYIEQLQSHFPAFDFGRIAVPKVDRILSNVNEEVSYFTDHVIAQVDAKMAQGGADVESIKDAWNEFKGRLQKSPSSYGHFDGSDFVKQDARIYYQLQFHQSAYEQLRDIPLATLRAKFGEFMGGVSGVWPSQLSLHKWGPISNQLIERQLARIADVLASDPNKDITEKMRSFQNVLYSSNYQNLWAGFILSLLPEEKLENFVSFDLRVRSKGVDEYRYNFGKNSNTSLYRSMYFIQSTLNDQSNALDPYWAKKEDGTLSDDLSKLEQDL